MSSNDSLARLAATIESRKPANGGDPQASYVARLLHKGPDAFLKKIGEEATEVVMANEKLYVNREEGFIGTGLKKDEFVCDCSDIDDIIEKLHAYERELISQDV